MKLATRIWLVSSAFVGLSSIAMMITVALALGPMPLLPPPGMQEPPAGGPLALTSVLLLALVGAAFVAARSVVQPLLRLQSVARRIGDGDFAARAHITTRDEVGDVARAVDDMAGRIESLVRAQRELLANVSHELRTPLSRVKVALELSGLEHGGLVRGIVEDLDEVEQLINDVLTASKLDPALHPPQHVATLTIESVSAADIVALAVERVQRSWPQHTFHTTVDDVVFDGDLRLLVRLLANLLDNAAKYSAAGSDVDVMVTAGDGVEFVVRDHGIGLQPSDVALLGTPFFRADASRARAGVGGVGGVGLGVVLARRIAEAHRGSLTYASVVGEGTTATMALPRSMTRVS